MGQKTINLSVRGSDFSYVPYLDPQDEPLWKRTIVYDGPTDALSPNTHVILGRLGYRMFLPETFSTMCDEHPSLVADLLLVDERRLVEVKQSEADDPASEVPIVLLTGRRGAVDADSRIVGAVKRPAGLHDLYRLMQQLFEDTPRSTPRVQIRLLARCEDRDRDWNGVILSLSENGCLIRCVEAIPLGQKMRIDFSLPGAGRVSLEAEATYQLLPDVGLVFNTVPASCRRVLERFVADSILSA